MCRTRKIPSPGRQLPGRRLPIPPGSRASWDLGLGVLAVALGLLVLGPLGCSGDNPVSSIDADFVYPLAVGNRWEYARRLVTTNFRPDSLAATGRDTVIASTSSLEIVRRATLLDSLPTYVLRERLTQDGVTFESEAYYANQEDGLYFYAYEGPGYVIPKVSPRKRIYFQGHFFSSVRELLRTLESAVDRHALSSDSLIYENPPLKALPYPLELGAEWTYRPPGRPWRIDKKVVGQEDIEVPSGKFRCHKIQWFIEIQDPEKLEFFDYVGSAGLIRRHVVAKDLIVTSEDSPEPIGMYDVEEISDLSAFELKE